MARWLAPSAVAACAGGIVAGACEGAGMDDVAGFVAAAGFLALVGVPLLLAVSVLVRALWAAWRPRELGERLVEPGGGAPRLAGWAVVISLGAFGLAWAMYQGTWILAGWTAFKPLSMSFAEPLLALAAVLILVAISRPSVDGIAALVRWIDTRRQRSPRRSLLTPWRIALASLLTTIPLAYALAIAKPIVAVSAAVMLLAISRVARDKLASLVDRLDQWWLHRPRHSLVTPRRIAIANVLGVIAVAYTVWRLAVRTRIGVLDLGVLDVPMIGVAVAVLVHIVWRRLPARSAIGGALGAIAVATIAFALYAWKAHPSLTLAIWGERPLAGFTIDKLFDLDAIRSGVSLSEFRPSLRPGAVHPDIILVTIDTVRADHTPAYGGSAEMPALRDLAQKGAVFEWAFSPSNVTRRSIPSMVIGLQPNRVRGRVVGWALRVDPRHVLMPERMRAGGYDTAGFMCCSGFWGGDFHTGLDRGLEHLEVEVNGLALARRARAWLDEREKHPTGRPLFLWMHILEPHNWQAASGEPRNDDERRRFYDRSLAASDTMLVEILGAFSQRSPEKTPIIIVSADHGEALGDHGQPYHSTDLYDSQIRVPLVIAGPGIKPGRIEETVSLNDLTPTILELAGFEPPHGPSIDGRSVADLATGKRASIPEHGVAFAAMIKDRSNPGGITAIVKGRYKLIDNGSSLELYDLHTDPGERSNLISAKPPIVEELKKLLKQHLEAGSKSPF
jgi:arylsulfatase A-like enzyme